MTLISFSTTQISAFGTAFEAIDSLLADTILVFTPEGITIKDVDKTGSLLVCAFFDASKFDVYTFGNSQTTLSKYKLGVAVDTIVRAVRTNLPYDVMTCSISDYDGNPPRMSIALSSKSRGDTKIAPIRLIDVQSSGNDIASMEYQTSMTINPSILTKYIKDLNHVSDTICLTVAPTSAEIVGTNGGNVAAMYHLTTGKGIEISSDVTSTMTRRISVKKLLMLNKTVNLSHTTTIYIDNNLPLIFEMSMASLGVLKLVYV